MATGGFGSGSNAIFICDICGTKWPYRQQNRAPDTNAIVCPNCLDQPNPYIHYRVKQDRINLARPRPDVPLTPLGEDEE